MVRPPLRAADTDLEHVINSTVYVVATEQRQLMATRRDYLKRF
jgi:hypothetical protein